MKPRQPARQCEMRDALTAAREALAGGYQSRTTHEVLALIDAALAPAEPQDAEPAEASSDAQAKEAERLREIARDASEFATKHQCDVMRLRTENFALAAGQCCVKDGLLGDESGNQYCRLEKEEQALRKALELSVQAMRAPFDGWKGELERKALDAARAALRSKT